MSDFSFKVEGGVAVATPKTPEAKQYLQTRYGVEQAPVAMNEHMFMPFSVQAMAAGLSLTAEDK